MSGKAASWAANDQPRRSAADDQCADFVGKAVRLATACSHGLPISGLPARNPLRWNCIATLPIGLSYQAHGASATTAIGILLRSLHCRDSVRYWRLPYRRRRRHASSWPTWDIGCPCLLWRTTPHFQPNCGKLQTPGCEGHGASIAYASAAAPGAQHPAPGKWQIRGPIMNPCRRTAANSIEAIRCAMDGGTCGFPWTCPRLFSGG